MRTITVTTTVYFSPLEITPGNTILTLYPCPIFRRALYRLRKSKNIGIRLLKIPL